MTGPRQHSFLTSQDQLEELLYLRAQMLAALQQTSNPLTRSRFCELLAGIDACIRNEVDEMLSVRIEDVGMLS